MSDDFDFGPTLAANSDQLNAIDLMGGPVTVTITAAKQGTDDKQPLILRISGDHKPWKPCKTMRRLMAAAIGTTKAGALVGRSVTLYRDPEVKWAGKKEGGIRLSHMSGIKVAFKCRLRTSKEVTEEFTVLPLDTAPPDLTAVLASADLTEADLDRWRGADKPPVSTLTPDQRGKLAAWLTPDRLATIPRQE